MDKRSFFKLLAGATAAAAMEVCGLLPTRRAVVLNGPPITRTDMSGMWYNGTTGITAKVAEDGTILKRWTETEMNQEYMDAFKRMYSERFEAPTGTKWVAISPPSSNRPFLAVYSDSERLSPISATPTLNDPKDA